jgi:Arc/MetJ family transcription regulator
MTLQGSEHSTSFGHYVTDGKTSVELDREIASQAAEFLGTTTLRDTIDTSLRDVVDAKRRLELVASFADTDPFDLDQTDSAWGSTQLQRSAIRRRF